jgi:hypothetical protein
MPSSRPDRRAVRRSTTVLVLAVLLLTMGVVVGRFTSSGERPGEAGDVGAVVPVSRSEPVSPAPAPALATPEVASGADAEASALREALEAARAERDRLAAELAAWKERADDGETLADLERARKDANEVAAVATARNAISAMAQIQASSKIDEDLDGTGEYGGFLEMSAAAVGRMANGRPLAPPVLSGAFRTLTSHGEAYRAGYLYRLFLPDARGNGVGEGPQGYAPGQVDPDLAETTWCLYAWPAVGGVSGQRTFFANQAGDVLATEDARYVGPGNGPPADAAFRGSGGIAGAAAVGVAGNDGNVWKQVN